jgi:two-component system sensor histidine kinase YesM
MLPTHSETSSKLYKFFTLKKRIIILFISSSLLIFTSTAFISYYAISSILTNKMNRGIESNLRQIQLSLQNTITNLNHVSQQLASQGSVGMKLEQYLSAGNSYDKSKLMGEMKTELNLITFTNPGVGLVMYYFQDDRSYLFENMVVKREYSIEKLPKLAGYYGVTYYGPHESLERYNNQYVLSALRKVEIMGRSDAYVYIESGFKLTENLLDSDGIGSKTFHLMLDNDGRIAYSQNDFEFPVNSFFPDGKGKTARGSTKDFYWYKSLSNQGWSIVSVVAKVEFNREKNLWIRQMLVLLIVLSVFSLFLALLLWKMVYMPLNKFNKEMRFIEHEDFHAKVSRTKIPEFDFLLNRFQEMKKQILDLFREVEVKEKRRADLEIEKLRYQINPHFLMNTINSVQWLAVANNQPEIERVAVALNKLLFYNLGGKGATATVQDEIAALEEYLALQRFRYDFQYEVAVNADQKALNMTMPRFVLQPIVENAIHHGLEDKGSIRIDVAAEENLMIVIQDTGKGMSEETIQTLLSEKQIGQEKVGMGIGLNYVKRMLESYYDGRAVIDIKSTLGKGTSIILQLPLDKEASENVKSVGG